MWLFPTPSAYNPVKSIISPQNNKTAIICTKNTPSARIPPFPPAGSCSMPSLLSDQAMCLSFIKKHAIGGRFSGLGCTFQGQKHGCKDFGIPLANIIISIFPECALSIFSLIIFYFRSSGHKLD
jgi:hypothetical protein